MGRAKKNDHPLVQRPSEDDLPRRGGDVGVTRPQRDYGIGVVAHFLKGRPGPWDGAVAVPREEGVCRLAAEPDAPIHRFIAEHQGRYDLVVQMHGGGRESNPVVRALRPRWAVGSCTPGSAALDRCIPYVPGRPEVVRWLEVVELAGAEPLIGSRSLTPTLPVTSADVEAAGAAWPHAGPIVLLHVGARDTRRRWSPAKFASVTSSLRARSSSTVLLVGTDRDHRSSAEVVRLVGDGAVDLTGRLSLGGLLGLARRSLLFLGNDSGPRHLAAAAGTPTVGVFWVPNAMSFGPLAGAANRLLVSYTVTCPTCGQEQIHHRCEHDVSLSTASRQSRSSAPVRRCGLSTLRADETGRRPATVTIVIASRNRWPDLQQSLPRHHAPVILIDNGSTDGTPELVRTHFPHIKVVAVEKNLGSSARNLGVELAATPYVAFSDDDSWWEPGALTRASALFAAHPSVGLIAVRILVGSAQRLDPTCSMMMASPLGHRNASPAPPCWASSPAGPWCDETPSSPRGASTTSSSSLWGRKSAWPWTSPRSGGTRSTSTTWSPITSPPPLATETPRPSNRRATGS